MRPATTLAIAVLLLSILVAGALQFLVFTR